jgi:hypothetical protein
VHLKFTADEVATYSVRIRDVPPQER